MMDWTSPDQTARLLTGHVLDRLRDLPDASVHCVVTSPPYYGLRRYGVEGEFGAEPLHDCLGWSTRSPCGGCFVCHLVEVMREVRRVLHPSGTVWLNLGDSFANDGKWGGTTGGKHAAGLHGEPIGRDRRQTGLKPKDQCMIPARTALALQADGWWVRSDVIWAKPNGMPGSQEDRPTINHEYVYLLAKSGRYFYDHYAIREQSTNRASGNQGRFVAGNNERGRTNNHMGSAFEYQPTGTSTARSVWTITPQPFRGAMCRACRTVYLDGTQRFAQHDGDKSKPICPTCGAWDQWLSHFAVMPERLAERCILAGTSERGVCPTCGEPWRRIIEAGLPSVPDKSQRTTWDYDSYNKLARGVHRTTGMDALAKRMRDGVNGRRTIGWQPACQCVDGPFPDFIGDHQPTVGTCSPPEPVAATVLDPFAGTGTTLAVARRLGRHALGIELNPDYAEICQARVMAPPRRPKTKPAIVPDARQQTLF